MRKVKYYRVYGNGMVSSWHYFGTFHGWGISEGNSCAVVEIDHLVERIGSSGEEKRDDIRKGTVELITLHEHVLQFLE